MNNTLKKRLARTAILSMLALMVGGGISFIQMQGGPAQIIQKGFQENTLAPMAGLSIGGTFALTDQAGKAVTEADFKTPYKLVYFGFTACPMICPTELRKIAGVINDLGPVGENIQPLFITVDPARDTPETLANYVSLFHPRLVGLTGTPEQIETVKQTFKVFAAKARGKDPEDYLMDHSSFIYLMGPDNQLLALYRVEDAPEFLIKDIKNQISL